MTLRLLITLVFATLLGGRVAAQTAATLPPNVQRGFDLMAHDSAAAAVAYWATDWNHEIDAGKAEQIINGLKTIADYAGAVRGVDLVAIRQVSPNFLRVFAIIRYERMPVFLELRPYNSGRSTPDWRMATITFNTDATKVFPPDLWPR